MSLKTCLHDEHVSLGAKIVDFAGWSMPIQYQNLKEEVIAVRESAGVFDVSHMGEFFINGSDAVEFADYIVTNDIKNTEMKKAIYSPMCRENGTIIDDLIVYKLSDTRIMICVNASNIDKDLRWMKSHIQNFACDIVDASDKYSLLAIQGPNAFAILSSLNIGLQDIEYYSVQVSNIGNEEVIFARTGYTGEDGFEVFASHEVIKNIWKKLMEQNVRPCGLGARDVLRLEVCYPLYGHELSDDVTPLDSALKWTIKADKNNFIGKKALQEYQSKTRLLKIILDKGIPREGYSVEKVDGQKIGNITSGTMSVALKKGIALCRVEKDLYGEGDQIVVDIRGKKYNAQVIKKPFVAGGHK